MKGYLKLSQSVLEEIQTALLDVLANSYALYLKTQTFHWNVRGSQFHSLHQLFEHQYKELSEAIDEVAERIRAIGFLVEGSFSAFQKRTQIQEANLGLNSLEMCQDLALGHQCLSELMHPLILRLQTLNDHSSSDLLIKRQSAHDKAAWMLKSHFHAE